MYDIQQLQDRAEIQDLIYKWCRAVDRCDWELARSLFYPDCIDNHGLFRGDRDQLIAWLAERHQRVTQSMHLVGNILIEFVDADKALVETYVVGYQRYPDGDRATRIAILGEEMGSRSGELDMVLPGRYVDTVERRDGVWRIAARTTVFESISARLVEGGPQIADDWERARRDDQDFICRRRRELGL